MTDVGTVRVFSTPSPVVRLIAPDRPWTWLNQGFADMKRAWPVSLAYGAILAGTSWALVLFLTSTGYFHLFFPLCAAFMLIAPLLAAGLYETSRRLQAGEPVSLTAAVTAFLKNGKQLGFMGVVLMVFFMAWMRFAALLFAIFFVGLNPTLDNLIQHVFTTDTGLVFLTVGTVLGSVLAATVFAIAAVSIPMLMDRETNVFSAIATSAIAVRSNVKPMLLWAFIIVFCTGVGMVTLLFGLALALPLIGHATWHAYRDLVVD